MKEFFGLSWQNILGLVSASAALFYINGWMYEAHWHGYYGIEVAQLQLDATRIMVQGVPGILLLIVSVLFALAVRTLWKVLPFKDREKPEKEDGDGEKPEKEDSDKEKAKKEKFETIRIVIFTTLSGNVIALFIVLGVLSFFEIDNIPLEFRIFVIPGVIVVAILVILSVILAAINRALRLTIWAMGVIRKFASVVIGIPFFIAIIYIKRFRPDINLLQSWRDLQCIFRLGFDSIKEKLESVKDRYDAWTNQLLRNTWRFWIGLVILFFFLASVAMSAMLGEFDARRGARLLSGNWPLRQVFVYSKRELKVLENRECIQVSANNTEQGQKQEVNLELKCLVDYQNKQVLGTERDGKVYIYGPFGLVENIGSTWFLADWKESWGFEERPELYIIPRVSEEQRLYISPATSSQPPVISVTATPMAFQVSTSTPTPSQVPTFTPTASQVPASTPTSFPTPTNTPTPSPTLTSTPTPSPTPTSTPMPTSTLMPLCTSIPPSCSLPGMGS